MFLLDATVSIFPDTTHDTTHATDSISGFAATHIDRTPITNVHNTHRSKTGRPSIAYKRSDPIHTPVYIVPHELHREPATATTKLAAHIVIEIPVDFSHRLFISILPIDASHIDSPYRVAILAKVRNKANCPTCLSIVIPVAMVMSIMLAQGVSEKGAEKWLKPSQLLGEMLQKVGRAANSRGRPLVLLYCGDGSDLHSWTKVEIKCLIRLIGHHCPGLEIVSRPFSFYDSDAVQKLNQGDIFY